LIATSEQPISAYHKDEWLEEKSLPLQYAGTKKERKKEKRRKEKKKKKK
jgi:seryl-tRNA synthetase